RLLDMTINRNHRHHRSLVTDVVIEEQQGLPVYGRRKRVRTADVQLLGNGTTGIDLHELCAEAAGVHAEKEKSSTHVEQSGRRRYERFVELGVFHKCAEGVGAHQVDHTGVYRSSPGVDHSLQAQHDIPTVGGLHSVERS